MTSGEAAARTSMSISVETAETGGLLQHSLPETSLHGNTAAAERTEGFKKTIMRRPPNLSDEQHLSDLRYRQLCLRRLMDQSAEDNITDPATVKRHQLDFRGAYSGVDSLEQECFSIISRCRDVAKKSTKMAKDQTLAARIVYASAGETTGFWGDRESVLQHRFRLIDDEIKRLGGDGWDESKWPTTSQDSSRDTQPHKQSGVDLVQQVFGNGLRPDKNSTAQSRSQIHLKAIHDATAASDNPSELHSLRRDLQTLIAFDNHNSCVKRSQCDLKKKDSTAPKTGSLVSWILHPRQQLAQRCIGAREGQIKHRERAFYGTFVKVPELANHLQYLQSQCNMDWKTETEAFAEIGKRTGWYDEPVTSLQQSLDVVQKAIAARQVAAESHYQSI